MAWVGGCGGKGSKRQNKRIVIGLHIRIRLGNGGGGGQSLVQVDVLEQTGSVSLPTGPR